MPRPKRQIKVVLHEPTGKAKEDFQRRVNEAYCERIYHELNRRRLTREERLMILDRLIASYENEGDEKKNENNIHVQ